jgi:RNA polymerase sigma-70 factor (ECF subfamily)
VTARVLPFRRVAGVAGELSDAALLAACAVGDASALGALFDRHQASVYRFLSRLAGADERDLDDLVQATFLGVLRAAARFEARSSVRTWIFSIAANVVRHHVRGEARRRGLHAAWGAQPPGSGGRPDDDAERREAVARLGRALEALPHEQRVAFVLCALEGVPGAEAARALGVRENAIWRRLHAARNALRAAVDPGGTMLTRPPSRGTRT